MKKGVVVLGGFVLGLATCIPVVAQPSSKAVETIVVDNFDTDMEWEWNVQASRFVSDGYPIIKKFEGIPNSLIVYRKESDPTAMVLGTKVKFNRKGDNWFEIFPTKDDAAYEIDLIGTVTQIDFWVWGASYKYNLELLVRDCDGRVHALKAGSLQFSGWRNIIVNIPGYIRQHSRLRSGRKYLSFVGFRVRTDADEAVDDYVIYFDQLKYTTNTLADVYDGYALKDADFGDSQNSSEEDVSDSSQEEQQVEETEQVETEEAPADVPVAEDVSVE